MTDPRLPKTINATPFTDNRVLGLLNRIEPTIPDEWNWELNDSENNDD